MNDGTIMGSDELQILFNILGDDLTISYPLTDQELVVPKLRPHGYLLGFPNKESLDDHSLRFGDLREEIPTFNDLKTCILCSGIISYTNEDKIRDTILRYNRSPKSVLYGLDTNMLYNNFMLNHDFIGRDEVLIVDIIQEELMTMMDRKFRDHEVRSIKELAPYHGKSFNLLNNKLKKRSRMAKIASRDLDYLKGHFRMLEREGSGKADKVIVETLSNHSGEVSSEVVLITADDAMTDLCRVVDLSYIKCDLPYEVKDTECSYHGFERLVFNMVSMFGFIKLGPVLVYGEYPGSSSNRPDDLMVVDEYGDRRKKLERELELCRKLKGLEIER